MPADTTRQRENVEANHASQAVLGIGSPTGSPFAVYCSDSDNGRSPQTASPNSEDAMSQDNEQDTGTGGEWSTVERKRSRPNSKRGKARTPKHKTRSKTSVNVITVSNHEQKSEIRGALVDRGANGGVAGSDTRLMRPSGRQADITGVDWDAI